MIEKFAAVRLCALCLAAQLALACSGPNAQPDGGARTDAGISDAGTPDAGAADAGNIDAGDIDAGNIDAGSIDAGSIDAGSIDGGTLSSGGAATHLLLFGGLAYDPDAGSVNDPSTFLSDTWTWDGAAWTQLAVQGPPARWGSIGGLVDGQIVLFGGVGAQSTLLDDTWTWDGAAWTQHHVAGPSARAIAQGGTLGAEFVLYGGYDIGNDLWTWDGAQWTERFPASSPGVAPAVGLANSIYEGTLFLTNGSNAWSWDGGTSLTVLGDGGTLPGPAARSDAMAATLGSAVVMWGGSATTDDAPFDETWVWNGSAWAQSGGAVQPPIDQTAAGMAALAHQVVLLAGTAPDGGAPHLEMWSWSGTAWTKIDAQMPGYRSHAVLVAY